MKASLFRQIHIQQGFPDSLLGKESACNARDSGHGGSIPGSGRSPGEVLGNPLQYSWAFPGGRVVKSLPSYRRYKRYKFDSWVVKIPWNRTWQPIPVLLPGKFHGQKSLAVHGVTKSQTQLSAHTHTPVFLPEKSYGQRWWAAVQRRDWTHRHTHSTGRMWAISETPRGVGVTSEGERGPDLRGG